MHILFHILIGLLTTPPATLAKSPPGTAPVPGINNLYMDKSEIKNIDWREYLYWLEKNEGKESDTYKAALPDMEVWKSSYNTDFFKPGIYNHYPLIGVNFPQVLAYCSWRSDRVSEIRKKKIRYFLPSFREYYLTINIDSTRTAAGLYSIDFDHRRSFIGLCDNAAEMTNIEGLAVQGFRENGNCLDSLRYRNTLDFLGFRCAAKFEN